MAIRSFYPDNLCRDFRYGLNPVSLRLVPHCSIAHSDCPQYPQPSTVPTALFIHPVRPDKPPAVEVNEVAWSIGAPRLRLPGDVRENRTHQVPVRRNRACFLRFSSANAPSRTPGGSGYQTGREDGLILPSDSDLFQLHNEPFPFYFVFPQGGGVTNFNPLSKSSAVNNCILQ